MALPTRQPPQLFRPLRKYACTETLSLDQGRETNPSSHQLTLSPEIAARIAKSDASRQKLFLKKTVLVQDPDSSKYNTGSRTCHMELTLNVGRLPNWTFRDIDTGSSLHFPIQDLTATAQVFLVSNRTGENSQREWTFVYTWKVGAPKSGVWGCSNSRIHCQQRCRLDVLKHSISGRSSITR